MLKLDFTKDDFNNVVSGQDLGNSDNDVLMVMVVMMMRWSDRNTDSDDDVDDVIKDDKGTEAISTVRWQGTSLICVQSFYTGKPWSSDEHMGAKKSLRHLSLNQESVKHKC